MFQLMIERPPVPALLTVEFKNTRPVDLVELAISLRAFGEAYADWADGSGWDVQPQNLRLYIHELRSGSIIAELAPWLDQGSLILDQAKTLAPFATALHAAIKYFLGKKDHKYKSEPPTRQMAAQVHAIMEPVARDGGSQLFLNVKGDVHIHHHYDSLEANAVQNGVKRFLGPQMPATQRLENQVMTLHQVRLDSSLRSGDRGIIEEISPKHVKINFATPEAKRQILDAPENPSHMAFLVDVDVKAIDGKPALYRVLEVKDSFERP